MSPDAAFALLAAGLTVAVLVALALARRRHEASCRRLEWREQVLLGVLRTDSLRPQAVLEAVVDGIEQAGFDASSIRFVDAEAGRLRYVAGRGLDGATPVPELPLGEGFAGRVLAASGPMVLDDYSRTAGVLTPSPGFAGMIGLPLGPVGQPIAIMLAGRRQGRVTPAQRQAAIVLGEQAGRALDQALRFEAVQGAVEELRRLDLRMQDFVSTVSHELRTPLTVVQGLGQTLARRWDQLDPDRRADLAARLDANAERLTAMVGSLLESSALEEGRLEVRSRAVALRSLLRAVIHRLGSVAASHPITLDVAAGVHVSGDPDLLTHVIENLLTNVVKHTPQGTPVRVSAVARADRVTVSVSDEGPGISPDDLPHVLERFYRGGEPTSRTSSGLGLGLALASQIVAAHGSRLEVASEVGRGTTFWFHLPFEEHPATDPA